jgi:hypothetical protein
MNVFCPSREGTQLTGPSSSPQSYFYLPALLIYCKEWLILNKIIYSWKFVRIIKYFPGCKMYFTYRTVPYRTVPYRTVPYRAVPCRTVPYRTVPYRTVPYRTVPYRTVPYRTVL